VTEDKVKQQLPPIKEKYKLVKLDLVVDSKDATKERVHIHGEINPTDDGEEVELEAGKTFMGAKKSGDTFEGDFDHAEWSWDGYPPVASVMMHPANAYTPAGYQNNASISKPTGSYKVSGNSQGAPEPEAWRGHLDSQKNQFKTELMNGGMSKGDAEDATKDKVVTVYKAQGYAFGWLDLYLLRKGPNEFQGHPRCRATRTGSSERRPDSSRASSAPAVGCQTLSKPAW